ncbi:MAG: hypothetical protein ACYDEJ_15900 [Desulfitobacteriaceae bacterium]
MPDQLKILDNLASPRASECRIGSLEITEKLSHSKDQFATTFQYIDDFIVYYPISQKIL